LTLVEALVVLGVVGIVVSLSIPAIQKVRGLADRTACQSNMRQMMTAMHHYHQDHGALPPKWHVDRNTPGAIQLPPEARMSWQAHLLLYIEQERLYKQALEDFRRYPSHEQLALHQGQTTVIKLYGCPSDGRTLAVHEDPYGDLGAFTSYIAAGAVKDTRRNKYHSGALGRNFAEITDGTGNTIAFGERPPPETLIAGWWYHHGIFWGGKLRGPNNYLFMDGAMMVSPSPHPDCSPRRTPSVQGG
jgi:type II secretory pathway pseudopilin PulG